MEIRYARNNSDCDLLTSDSPLRIATSRGSDGSKVKLGAARELRTHTRWLPS